MKKLISTATLFASAFAFSQITFGARANALFNTSSASWENLQNTVKEKNVNGFNVGLAVKVDLPITGWFVMPEVYYTSFKNTATIDDNVKLEAKSNRIDVPVLIGHNFLLGKLAAFVGPVASYNLSKDNTYENFEEDVKNEFKVGYQFGAQATISNFVISARYEGAFSKDSRKFVNKLTGKDIHYDNRPSMFILGIGYNFN